MENELKSFLKKFVVPQKKIRWSSWGKDDWFLPNKQQDVANLVEGWFAGIDKLGISRTYAFSLNAGEWSFYEEEEKKDCKNCELLNALEKEIDKIKEKMK